MMWSVTLGFRRSARVERGETRRCGTQSTTAHSSQSTRASPPHAAAVRSWGVRVAWRGITRYIKTRQCY
eukprot:6188224-Pleurochrysis_carterae.AAC.2